ncbi:MAG: hypothetical protein AB1485_00075 [Candidatus Thermoplasmatota archaeon]
MGIKIVDKREEDKVKEKAIAKIKDFIGHLKIHRYWLGNPLIHGVPTPLGKYAIYKTTRLFPFPKHRVCGFFDCTNNIVSIETSDSVLVELIRKYAESSSKLEFEVTIRERV